MKKFSKLTGPRNNKHWSAEEDAKLKDMRRRMLRAKEIAQELGRSQKGVERRLWDLAIRLMPAVSWEEVLCQPHTVAELAETTGRERSSITNMRTRLRKQGLPVHPLGRRPRSKAGAA